MGATERCITFVTVYWNTRYPNQWGDDSYLQYIPRKMHTAFALLCFVVVIHWLIFPYPSGLLHWHCGNLTIAPVPAKQPWWIWINTSCEFIVNDCISTTKQSTTKPCAYFYCTCLWPDANGWVEGYYRSNKTESLFVPTVAAKHDAVIKWKLFRVTGPLCGEFTGHRLILAQRPVTRNFDVFYDLRLNKRLSKQSWGWWFETSSRSSCRHCNG